MERNLFVLHNVSDFAPGAFENVAVEDGCMQLGHSGGGYLLSGCYTSPAFRMEEFSELIPSWNVDTPRGTEVEVQARVNTGGKWSSWFSFGRWSPFIQRASLPVEADGPVTGNVGRITINSAEAYGQAAQVRIWLYSDGAASPMVHLLALSVRPRETVECIFPGASEIYKAPAYSCLVRDPSIAGRMAVPTALGMMMNRYGEDVLPEEVARNMYDAGSGRFGNLAFISAAAGMFGYECYARYLDAGRLRSVLRYGTMVAAMVSYRAQSLAEEENPEMACETVDDTRTEAPVLRGASHNSSGHLVLVRGFSRENGVEMVHISDPLAPTDAGVERAITFQDFCGIYYGFFYTMKKPPRWHGRHERMPGFAKPERRLTQLGIEGGSLHLMAHGEELELGEDLPVNVSKATICYTLSDGVAYASAAQKRFYYLAPDEKRALRFDRASAEGRKLTVYVVGSRGTTWVAEKRIEKQEKGNDQ